MNGLDLDIERPGALEAYLRTTRRVGPGSRSPSGCWPEGCPTAPCWSNGPDGEAWVVKQALPKLRVAVDWFSDPARIEREAAGMRWLAELAPEGSIPR